MKSIGIVQFAMILAIALFAASATADIHPNRANRAMEVVGGRFFCFVDIEYGGESELDFGGTASIPAT